MIKLFVSDMDGTLLNANHVISDQTAKAIKRLQDYGIEFMIATGRTFHSAKILLDLQGIDCDMINLNGAAVYDRQGNVLKSIPIDRHLVNDIITFCQNIHLEYSIMTAQHFYAHDRQAFVERISKYVSQQNSPLQESNDSSDVQFLNEFENIRDITEFQQQQKDEDVLKFMVMSDSPKSLQQFKRLFEKNGQLDITSSNHDNLEITNINAQKGFAVQEYASSKGITMDEVLCIGDSLNDRSMIMMAKYGYVMKNGVDELKNLSPLRAPHHDQEGVAQIIDQLIQ